MRLRSCLLFTALFSVFAATPTFATTIDLGIVGSAEVGSTFIDFGNALGTAFPPAPGYGVFSVPLPPDGIFSPAVQAGETGKIQSLDASKTQPGTILTPDPTSSAAFMTFDTGGSNLKIFLTELLPGSSAGPFTLIDSTNGAVAYFNVDGFVYNSSNQSSVDFTGTFSATFNGMTVADLLSDEAKGEPITTPFLGTFTITTSPEPGSLMLLGAGLLGMGLISRRKSRS